MKVSAVIIGRNEGARLERCIASVRRDVDRVVYVDSGSIDDSVEIAVAEGAEVVVLDGNKPFTAARGRNAGVDHLQSTGMQPDLVQFVDGDCEMLPSWIAAAASFLSDHPHVAVVCGRRRERQPEASVYNRLCDSEWATDPGPAKACGGDAMVRLSALEQVGGFNAVLIAGEEPEMCVRLRRAGWTIWRLDAEMTLHDAAITRFSQWWKRMKRGGFAAAQGASIHGAAPEYHGVRTVLRAIFWGAVLPSSSICLALALGPWALLAFLLYPLQIVRVAIRDGGGRAAWEQATFLLLGKFAELGGMIRFLVDAWSHRRTQLMEYR